MGIPEIFVVEIWHAEIGLRILGVVGMPLFGYMASRTARAPRGNDRPVPTTRRRLGSLTFTLMAAACIPILISQDVGYFMIVIVVGWIAAEFAMRVWPDQQSLEHRPNGSERLDDRES